MATSEARILANRENARKSTGPRTEAGKARSRRNALRHGLAGEGAVMLPEDEARLQQRTESWSECLGARDDLEAYLISRAAFHSVKLDRAARVDAARVVENVRQAERDFQPERIEQVARLASAMRLLHRLALTLEHRGWLNRDELQDLGALLAPFEPGDPRPVELAFFGREALPPPSADEPAPSTLPPELLALHPAPPPPPESETDRARREAARAALATWIAMRRQRLDEQRTRLLAEIETPEALAEARERAAFDDSDRGTLLRRYETAGELGLFRILNYLERRQRLGDPEPVAIPPDAPAWGPPAAPSSRRERETEPKPPIPSFLQGSGRREVPDAAPPAWPGPAAEAPQEAPGEYPEPGPQAAPGSLAASPPHVNLGNSDKMCGFLNEPNAPPPPVENRADVASVPAAEAASDGGAVVVVEGANVKQETICSIASEPLPGAWPRSFSTSTPVTRPFAPPASSASASPGRSLTILRLPSRLAPHGE